MYEKRKLACKSGESIRFNGKIGQGSTLDPLQCVMPSIVYTLKSIARKLSRASCQGLCLLLGNVTEINVIAYYGK